MTNKNMHAGDMAINTRTSWRLVLRPIGKLLIAAQLALVLQPLSVLAQDKGATPYNPVAQAQLQRLGALNQTIEQAKVLNARQQQSPADQVSDKLKQAQEAVARVRNSKASDKPARIKELKQHLSDIQAGTADVRAEFAATRAELQRKNLPAEILARHDEAVAQFEQRSAQFNQIAGKSNDDQVADELASFFDKYPSQRKPGKLDPKKLPWSTPEPNKRMPAETKTAWYQNLYADQKIRLAQAGGTNIGPLQFNIPPEPGQAPTVADLAETDEVQITAPIRAKAIELGNNPVNIYNWVRNNIEWAPTNGAIQSAQDTLDKLRGNATDTASLLIALLRAANIPARYQWGTIDVPADKAMNWVGGATVPQAALQILTQGGIAARGVTSAGQIATIRMEHVWVNAYVNWAPSRGNRNATDNQHPNPNANLNSWVPLDASFKQYSYTAAMNLPQAVPIDANALVAAAQQGATVNIQEGWVQNLNQVAIQSQLSAYQTSLQSYVSSTPTGTNSTVGDVIGKKIIAQQLPSLLAGTLTNRVIAQGNQASVVPSGLQHQFTYRLYASQTDQANDNRLLTYTEKTSKLVGRKVTLAYAPATQADADTVASFLPKPHSDGSSITLNDFPSGLPGYLINLVPYILVDGQIVAKGSRALPLGTDLYSTGGFTQLYDVSQWDFTSEETNAVGNSTAIGISAGGLSVIQLNAIKSRLQQDQAKLPPGPTQAASPNTLVGDVLTSAIWNWFAAAEANGLISKNSANMLEVSGLSYGLYHAATSASYSWGILRKVTFPGVNIDIGHVRQMTWAKDGDANQWIAYNRFRGQHMSALEYANPEQSFIDTTKCNIPAATKQDLALPPCPQGISALKALGLAATSGQKIFVITRSVFAANPGIVDQMLFAQSETTRNRVLNYLAIGYEVSIHEAPISIGGWSGAGFVAIDSATGAGAYIIEGGANGGDLSNQEHTTLKSLSALSMLIPSAYADDGTMLTDEQGADAMVVSTMTSIVNEVGALLSIVAGAAVWIVTLFDLAKYAGCPGWEGVWAMVNFFNIIGMILAVAGLFAVALSSPWAWLFLGGIIANLFGFIAAALGSAAMDATCRR